MIMAVIINAQVVSPFNKLKVKDSLHNYSFIISGHLHGASTNYSSFPASTLLANIDTLNSSNPEFMISLGDLFLDVNEDYLRNYKKSLFEKLTFPLFNAVGNHDLSNGNTYGTLYGKSFFKFQTGTELFIFLDTELNNGDIEGEQFRFLTNALTNANEIVRNVFILSHRPVWAQHMKKYSKLFEGNTRAVLKSDNFNSKILPLLKRVTAEKNVFWFSGSLGNGIASFFYDRNESVNITFMQTAIRDLPRDAVLKVNIKDSKVSFQGISFTGQLLKPVEQYNLEYWNKSVPEDRKINFRLVPYLLLKMISHHYFWSGFAIALTGLLFISLFIKWRKRR